MSDKNIMTFKTDYGPSNGLNFVLNSFGPISLEKKSKTFLMAITNENNHFDIYKDNYFIEPGNIYTYNIIASQIITSNEFDLMSQAERNCSLPDESHKLKLVNKYSKSACEYECAISFAMIQCGCIPWNLPKTLASEKLPICDLGVNNCFDQALRNFSTLGCGCQSGLIFLSLV
jgi:Amiloride-sensitive sodium channel